MGEDATKNHFVVCGRVMRIPLCCFDYKERDSFSIVPDSISYKQYCLKNELSYKEAISCLTDHDEETLYRFNDKQYSLKMVKDLNVEIEYNHPIDVLRYVVFYSDMEIGGKDCYPVCFQQLYYQRTSGELRIYASVGNEIISLI